MKRFRIPALLAALALSALLLAACDSSAPTGGKPQASTPPAATTSKADERTTAPAESLTPAPPESSEPTAPTPADPTEPTTPTTPAEPTPAPPAGDKGAAVAALAKTLEGKPYRYGAAGPDAFDNSGFVYYCLKQNGIAAPRKTGDLAQAGTAVNKEDLQAGDVVFFYNDVPGTAQYVGIYLGEGRFIACNNEEKPVVVQDMTLKYFTDHYVSARRF